MIHTGEKIVLVLQGGGALGAYQAGAYEGLSEAGLLPDWIAGISIGAINGALIAGNTPDMRVKRLREFWDGVSDGVAASVPGGTDGRIAFNEASAARASAFGVPGFFTPRIPPAIFMPPGSPAATSYYSTDPLRRTLSRLIDFELLNDGKPRYSAGAVEIETGNFAYFDSLERRIGVDHIMASGALPPGFPPVVIDGKSYWDGGLVSNTPLQYVLEITSRHDDMCVFQVDLFSARGSVPKTLQQVAQREKEIRYSSRTRLNTDNFLARQTYRRAAKRLLAKLPAELLADPDARLLAQRASDCAVTIVHLINRPSASDRSSMDYDFSRLSMSEHWKNGLDAVRQTLANPAWKKRTIPDSGVTVLDLVKCEAEAETRR